MPKNKVSDLITDQEIAFARLVLSGTMTDRRAAEAVGLNPDTAAYTRSFGSFGTDEVTTIGNATHLRSLEEGTYQGQMID